jgi:uncharacterized membrane protein
VPAATAMAFAAAVLVFAPVAALELGWTPILVGLAAFGGCSLALFALRLASAASVAAVRETSVVIAVALAAPLLGENVGPRRLAGAALVVVGIAVLGAA